MSVIEVKNVVKQYKIIKKEKGLKGAIKSFILPNVMYKNAVDDISYKIEQGEIVGYIGPNGAGKSTTIKMMTGILQPTSGEILVNGLSPQKYRTKVVKNIGVVFGQRSQLNWDLRLGETFELLKRIYDISDTEYKETMRVLNGILAIDTFIDTPVRQLSLGQRMRGDLAAAMIHSPKILFLDEPTIGLDVEAKYAVRKFIKEINERKKTTIILTTHDLGDIQELCKRIIIINEGKIIEDGSLSDITNRIAPYRDLVIDFYEPLKISRNDAEIIYNNEARTIYRFNKNQVTAAKLLEEISKEYPVKEFSINEPKIDDIIRMAYKSC